MGIDINAQPRPVPNEKLRRHKRLLALQKAWDEENLYHIDKCDGYCSSECAAKGCMTTPKAGEVWQADSYSSGGKNLVSLTTKILGNKTEL
jgi:hypothetical protein